MSYFHSYSHCYFYQSLSPLKYLTQIHHLKSHYSSSSHRKISFHFHLLSLSPHYSWILVLFHLLLSHHLYFEHFYLLHLIFPLFYPPLLLFPLSF